MPARPRVQPPQIDIIRAGAESLGIEFPGNIPDYHNREPEAVRDAFASEITRLLGDKAKGKKERKLSGEGVSLTVGSRLGLRKVPGEDGDPYGDTTNWGSDDITYGPERWIQIQAPLRLTGLGVDTTFETGVQLRTWETYPGLVDERPDDPENIRQHSRVRTLGTPVVASPAEQLFGLGPNMAFTETRSPGGVKWRNYADRGGNPSNDSLSYTEKNRVFGVGIELLRGIDPEMLVLK